jgi:putative ABC transport system permease protein
MSPPVPPKMKSDVPEVEEYVRFHSVSWNEKVAVESNGKQFLEQYFMMADPAFFRVFTYPLIKGDPLQALSELNNVVISESIARKLFATEDPIGQVITLKDNKLAFQVSGVMKDFPLNSHLRCDYLVSFENIDNIVGQGRRDAWGEFNYFAYLLLAPGADDAVAEQKIQAISVTIPGRENMSFQELRLQPIEDIHFQHSRGNLLPSYDKKYIYIFLTLAITVLVIATMNYFNLTTMLSMRRVKEVGVRKALGATSQQLSRQLMGENLGMVFLSLFIAIMLVAVLTPIVNIALTSPLLIDYSDPLLLMSILSIVLLLGLSSGSYLSLYINSFKAASILKGTAAKSSKGNTTQHTLIGIQFTLSLVLICSSLVITQQMKYVTHKDLGFQHDQLITVSLTRDVAVPQLSELKSELSRTNQVNAVAYSDFTPGRANWNQPAWWEGQTDGEEVNMFVMSADPQLLSTLRMNLVEGSFEALESSAERQYVMNEAARDFIGWDTALGKMISPFGEQEKRPVMAVVKDFNYTSLHTKIEPLIIVIYKDRRFSKLHVRLSGDDLPGAMAEVESVFAKVTNNQPFEYVFMDDSIGRLYQAEKQLGNVVLGLTVIAVAFALLGIYTLISFSIENRTKEIAIRKVLGISPASLVALFSKTYFKLAVIAAFVAVPLCWNLLGRWLNRFTYHIELSPLWFVVAVATVIVCIAGIALAKYVTMSKVNPANSLKYE